VTDPLHDLDKRLSVIEEAMRWKEKLHASEQAATKEITADRALDVARRLEGLNGEAGRLKTILDASVPQATFSAYILSQRDKEDEKEKSARERLDALSNRVSAREDQGKGMGNLWVLIVGALGAVSIVTSIVMVLR
jgi:hypothetical protein